LADSIISAACRRATAFAALALLVLACASATPARAETVVSLTFDDGIDSQYVQARPQLNARGMLGTFFINSGTVGSDGPNGYYMGWSQIDTLNAERHEIGGHTVDHVPLTNPGVDIRHQICDDAATLRGRGYQVLSFAYPHGAGATNATVRATLQDCGFVDARMYGNLRGPDCPSLGCPVAETIPPGDQYAFNSVGTQLTTPLTLQALQKSVTQAEEAGGGWVPIVFHEIDNTGAVDTVSPAAFTAFLDWLQARAASGTVVRTVRWVLGYPESAPGPGPSSLVAPSRVTADRVVGFAALRVRSRQDVDKLYVRAAMSEAGKLGASGAVKHGKRYPLKKVSKSAVSGKLVKLRLRLSKKGLRVVKQALARGKRVRAKIKITAKDAAGNVAVAKRTITLKD
jgi:peptidoglycan/xylan/chitin deacetylase (PgdA/CDA1 family)